MGRSKELIALADGKKVLPEELEKVYAASPLVREVAILEHHGRLAALVVPNEAAILERGALREAALLREAIEDLGARLPPYQRLTGYGVVRSALPRTQLGKLKRHLLPDLYAKAIDAAPRERLVVSAEDARWSHPAELRTSGSGCERASRLASSRSTRARSSIWTSTRWNGFRSRSKLRHASALR